MPRGTSSPLELVIEKNTTGAFLLALELFGVPTGAPAGSGQSRPRPKARINTTDPDSRPVKTATGFIQGYTAQALATEDQVIAAAELISGGNERHRRALMAEAAQTELDKAGIAEKPKLALADGRLLEHPQIEALEARGSSFSARPTRQSQGTEEDPIGPATSGCEDGCENPRPRRPTEDASR